MDKNRRLSAACLGLLACAAFSLSSCQQFFTTTPLEVAARAEIAIPDSMTLEQLTELGNEALRIGDVNLGVNVMKKITARLKAEAEADPTNADLFTSASWQAAITVSGRCAVLGSDINTFMTTAMKTFSSEPDEATKASLLKEGLQYVKLDADAFIACQMLTLLDPTTADPNDFALACIACKMTAANGKLEVDMTTEEHAEYLASEHYLYSGILMLYYAAAMMSQPDRASNAEIYSFFMSDITLPIPAIPSVAGAR